MPLARSLKTLGKKYWTSIKHTTSSSPSRALTITCQGNPINREELFKYTNGRFLANEKKVVDRRYVTFDIDRLCAIAASTGQHSAVCAIEKMEGGFSKALLLRKEDGSEIVAKIPFSIAGPPKYTTASEVAVLQYLNIHTQVPVPKVLAWSSDPSNPVGVEYIIMEKAPGVQLYKAWDDMSDGDQFSLVLKLTKLEGQIAKIRFPASGSLYLRESMGKSDAYVSLGSEIDPSEQFCIGPSCERGWYPEGVTTSLQSCFNRGPWPDLSSFGIALVERELALLSQNPPTAAHNPPRGSFDEQTTVLQMTKEVMSALKEPTFINKLSTPVLWHTDLHMGNIYVSPESPTDIVSLIDWQSIVVAPLLLQSRFPTFIPVREDYVLGPKDLPKLPPNYNDMDAEDKELADYQLQQAKLAKGWEMSTMIHNTHANMALHMPSFIRELFLRSAEVSQEGEISLRARLIELAEEWDELGVTAPCPVRFSADELERHERQFRDWSGYQDVQRLARRLLSTDFEGWIPPVLDFEVKQRENEELLGEFMRRSGEWNRSPEEMREIWPYRER